MLILRRSLNRCHVNFISRCHCIDVAFLGVVHRPVLLVTFRLHLSIVFDHLCDQPVPLLRSLLLSLFLRGGGGSLFLSPSLSSPSLSLLLRGPPFSQFSMDCASENSTFGIQTLMAMRKFLDEAELRSHQEISCSQKTKEVTNEGSTECKEEDPAEDRHSQTEAEKEVIRAFRTLLHGCEEQWSYATQQDSVSSESEAEEAQCQLTPHVMKAQLSLGEDLEDGTPDQKPQLYLCDDWIQPVMVARKPRVMTPKETMKANVAKNCLILTMMSLELGFGSVIERYQHARDAIVERYQQAGPENSVYLASEMLTADEMSARVAEQPDAAVNPLAAPASMPPPTCLVEGKRAEALTLSQVHAIALKDTSLKMYHVMSVKQTLREDLAECAYQFSCRAADWSRSDMHAVPMQFEPLELHVIDALGQQEVPDYLQQPAKAITEDVSVMKGPYAQEWIAAVLEEIESFKRLGVYEEVPKGDATSPPLPARLILVTKPNIHGGPARKKARIVNFQDVHPDEFTASKTPSYPALRMALSVASHMGWPVECWDVSTAFLYARLFGDRDTDLGGNEIYMRPPRILVETKVVAEGLENITNCMGNRA